MDEIFNINVCSPYPDYSSPTAFAGPRSPDTASPIYPERAIRPLPKNRLKSRLSPQQASTLVFPPEPPPISPILNFAGHDTPNGGHAHARATNGDASYLHNSVRQRGDADAHHHHHCTCGEEGDSGDDEVEFDHPDYRYAPPPTANGVTGQEKVDNVQRRLMDAARPTKPPPPASTASSADGYESFENTNNKKKRKIPNMGSNGSHHASLSADLAGIAVAPVQEAGATAERWLLCACVAGATISRPTQANELISASAGWLAAEHVAAAVAST